ncbi:uncharacterized protein C20orf194 homolog [Polypterus senegalus]|uniref:uncharacterized protein C20orf194 homolog n=1 Tax=Polypterus senegalus TaxID=55291 RepID=UPI001964B3CC|nr:uncharacterized protein C20orf194 homolog [Polypterus senegalus]
MASVRLRSSRGRPLNHSVSCSRLRRIQSILCSENKTKPDGILCILGIDSRYNEGCSELANYLLFGLYSEKSIDLERCEFPEEVLDDVILLIKSDKVHLYCNPVNYSYLLPYVSHWRNLCFHCMTEAEYEDEEAAEEFKISSFVDMVQDCSRIGVPYSSQGHFQKFDMFVVEKWPIIQAFALDGIGGGGFFTMKHKLIDVSEKLWEIYNIMDPVALENLLKEDLPIYEKQWNGLYSCFDVESNSSILEVSEAQAVEPFRSYFTHGLISSHITDSSKSRQPFVLFGSHSSRKDLNCYSCTFPSEGYQVRNTGSRGTAAKHMLAHCVMPKGPLGCARTCFFGTTHAPYLGNDNGKHKKTDLILLCQIYEAIVQSVIAAIKCFSCTFSGNKAKDMAEQTFRACLESYGLPQYKNELGSKTVFFVEAMDNEGRAVSLESDGSQYLVKMAFMMVYDIPDAFGEILGSLVFSESFLESCLSVNELDGSISTESSYTILTASIPRFVSWMAEDSDIQLSEKAQQLLKGENEEDECYLGRSLSVGESALIYSSSLLSSLEEGKISFFSKGILFVSSHFGSITLPMSLLNNLTFYDGGSSNAVAVLFIEYKSCFRPHLPFQLHCASNSVAIALLPKSKCYKAFYSEVLPSWKKQNRGSGVFLKTVLREQLSEDYRFMHSVLQKHYENNSIQISESRFQSKSGLTILPSIETFLSHFALSSSVGHEPVKNSHLAALLYPLQTTVLKEDEKMVISIITGLPGSHKDNLCNFLVNFNKEHGRWVVYRQASESCDNFNAANFQRYLSSVLESQRGRGARHSAFIRKKVRLLIVTPGYTDAIDVIQAFQSHPDPDVHAAYAVGCVTACVDPLTAYMEHRFLFPKFLEQCCQGLVSAVVFTSLSSDQRHPLLLQIQHLIRTSNPEAAFILAEKGAVTRNEDVDLILSESSFSDPELLKCRYLLYPGWCNGNFKSGRVFPLMSQVCIRFSRPLEKPSFMARCKAIKSSLKTSPFFGNVYNIRGRVRFSDCDKFMEVNHNTLTNSLSLVCVQEGPSPPSGKLEGRKESPECFVIFDGCCLNEDTLKDWLRQGAKQKPLKKALKRHETLTLQEIKMIHVKRHLDPLPNGYYYNGTQFVNFFGEKMDYHPLMEQFIDEYVMQANLEIERYNQEVDQQNYVDLFDP